MIENPGISAQRYLRETADGVIFLDPVFGTELSANEPPPSLLKDPITARGFSQVQKLAAENRLAIQFLLSYHGATGDFSDILGIAEEQLKNATLVGVEMDWKSVFDKDGTSTLDSAELILSKEGSRRRAFQDEQIRWLTKENKVILPCEYPDNYDGPLLQSLNSLLTLCFEADKVDDERNSIIRWGTYQTTRQWFFIGLIGYWLSQLESEGNLPAGKLKIPFMVGIAHTDISRKLQSYFSVPSETYTVAESSVDRKDYSSYLSIFSGMTANASVSREEWEHYLKSE